MAKNENSKAAWLEPLLLLIWGAIIVFYASEENYKILFYLGIICVATPNLILFKKMVSNTIVMDSSFRKYPKLANDLDYPFASNFLHIFIWLSLVVDPKLMFEVLIAVGGSHVAIFVFQYSVMKKKGLHRFGISDSIIVINTIAISSEETTSIDYLNWNYNDDYIRIKWDKHSEHQINLSSIEKKERGDFLRDLIRFCKDKPHTSTRNFDRLVERYNIESVEV